jgi:ribosomal protein S18 acetylase RimI-like enzyme
MAESSPTVHRHAPPRPPTDPEQRQATIKDETTGPDAPSIPLAPSELRHATQEDSHRLKSVLADAFFEDPIFGWLMPDDSSRRARLRRYFGIELRHLVLPRGRVWTTSDLTGAALTLPPGAWRSPLRVTLLEGSAFGVHVSRAARMGGAIEWRHVRGPHYYVRDVGVLPDMQGQGLGSALLRPTLERCDREGLPAYLEASNERSAALYERLGFKLTGELRIGSCPVLRLMLRPPQV